MGRQILVATDGSATGTAAVQWAARDAARRGATLRILHVLELPDGLDLPEDRLGRAEASGRDVLDQALQVVKTVASDLGATTELRSGPAAETILEEIGSADELVMGSRGRGGFSSMMLGSVSLKVAGHTPIPVVVVQDAEERRHGTIVVGYDQSDNAGRALEFAFAQATATGARLRVLSVWTTPVLTGYEYASAGALPELTENQRRLMREDISGWQRRYPDVNVESDVLIGHPVAILVDASAEADLVVVGSRGRGKLRSALLGSVSHGALHHCVSPVAVVGRND